MSPQSELDDFMQQLDTLIVSIYETYPGGIEAYQGLDNRLVVEAGLLPAPRQTGFATKLGRRTSMNLGSSGKSGYIVLDSVPLAHCVGLIKDYDRSVVDGWFVFPDHTVASNADGVVVPLPPLGTDLNNSSPLTLAQTCEAASEPSGRAQLLLVIADR